MSPDRTGAFERGRERLQGIRSDRIQRGSLAVLGVAIGLTISLVHWGGFLVAGLAVGLVAGTFREAVAGGVAVGVLAVGGFLGYAWWHDQLDAVLGLGELAAIAVVIPVGLTVLGSLVRGVT